MRGCEETPLLELIGSAKGERCHVLTYAGRASSDLVAEDHQPVEIDSVLEVGRSADVGSVPRLVVDDLHMSRSHARIRRSHNDCMTICDLGSSNGTFLEGVRLHEETPLHDGAVLFAGGSVFVYRAMDRQDLAAIRTGLGHRFAPVSTVSPVMARLTTRLRQLASSNVEILLTGETGVGKEVMAEAIHRESGRAGPFVAINCAALPEGLIESELFGYARGAHSTAVLKKEGLIEKAQGGTLYLDEIGEMSSNAQAKLLRFLQDRQYLALGTTRYLKLDIRIVAATRASVASGEGRGLRLDLAARLGPEPVFIPPLRERREDIGQLVQYFLHGKCHPFDIQAYRAMFLNPWQGNVRELEKTVRMAGVLNSGPGTFGLESMGSIAHPHESQAGRHSDTRSSARVSRPSPPELSALLERHRGNVGQMAREIGRQRTLVWRWLRLAGLEPSQYRVSMDHVSRN
jgi:transcriptional regulator with PAS, ATPase and Fis domain